MNPIKKIGDNYTDRIFVGLDDPKLGEWFDKVIKEERVQKQNEDRMRKRDD